MITEFKEFAIKGNVTDMAVGIVIGGAFTTIVKSMVDDLLMPALGLLSGGLDFSSRFIVLREGSVAGPFDSLAAAKASGATVLAYGVFINAVVAFLLVAMALFFVIRWMNQLRSPDTPPAPNTKPCPFCRSSIDIKATRCAHCTSELEAAEPNAAAPA